MSGNFKCENPFLTFYIFDGSGTHNFPYTYCEQIGKEIRDISDEIPFEIPESWEWCRLKNLTVKEIKRGKSPVYTDESSVLVFAQKCNLKTGGINIELAKYLAESVVTKYPQEEYMQANDIIVNSTGTGTLGRIGFYTNDDNPNDMPIVPDSHVTIVRVDEAISRYIYYVLKYYQPILEEAGEGSTKQKELKPDRIKELFIPLPPLNEQKSIAAKIEELLPYIEQYEKAETKLTNLNTSFPESLKKSILQEAVQGKLVPQNPDDEPASVLLKRIRAEKQSLIKAGKIKKSKHESTIVTLDKIPYEIIDGKERCIAHEVPFELPNGWCWCRLKNIINAVSARRVHQSDWRNNGIPFYRAREIAKLAENGYVNNELFISEELFNEYSKNGVPQSGDLMITAVGTLGKAYIVKETDKFYYKDASVICFENYGKICSEYIKYLMMSPYMETVIKDNSSGTTVGTITIVKANEYLIPLPPLHEQYRIVSKIEELMQYCEML